MRRLVTEEVRQEIYNLYEQGFSSTRIAAKVGFSSSSVGQVLRQYVRDIRCCICGDSYTVRGIRVLKTCYKEECKAAYEKTCREQYKKQGAAQGPIRPYTKTSDMMLVLDLEEGLSVKKIAKIYSRDMQDVEKRVQELKKDGTYNTIKKMLLKEV